MKNETFTPERIKAEADAFFEWDGEDRSLVTTTSCLLFAQHIAGLMQARSAQPAPVVPEGYVLVPKSMWVDAASIEALAFVMGGPEEDDGSPTYCDCVMWVGEIDDDGVKRHGIHVYNTECEEEGSTTLAEFAAAPAQGHQVDHIEQDLGMAQHARDSAELRRLCAERDEAKRQVAALRQHKTDYMEAAEVTRKALESELSALKAQQGEGTTSDKYRAELYDEVWQLARDMGYGNVTMALNDLAAFKALKAQQEPVAWRVTGAGGLTVTPEYPKWADDDSRLLIESLYTAPQPAPAQDVAGLLEWAVDRWHAEVANRPLQNVHRRSLDDTWRQVIRKLGGDAGLLCGPAHDALAAHDKQSGGEE